VYVANVDEAENTVEAREQSMQLQLQGGSAAVTAEESSRGLAEAQQELAGRGAGYELGFGYVKNFGSPRGLDGIRLEYAITDGTRTANLHVIISGTRLATLGFSRALEEPEEELRGWALDQLTRPLPRSGAATTATRRCSAGIRSRSADGRGTRTTQGRPTRPRMSGTSAPPLGKWAMPLAPGMVRQRRAQATLLVATPRGLLWARRALFSVSGLKVRARV